MSEAFRLEPVRQRQAHTSSRIGALAAVVFSLLAWQVPTAAAAPADSGPSTKTTTTKTVTTEYHCISPFGVDLNELYAVSEAIVGPCSQVNSGQRWVVGGPWWMNHTFELVPEGFEPAGETPLEDFVAKLVGVRYVVDPGTAKEKTFMFPNSDRLFTGPGPVPLEGFPFATPITLGTVRPQSVGEHTVESYWVFNALHCNGFTDVLEQSCLPAGETLRTEVTFQVRAGHHRR